MRCINVRTLLGVDDDLRYVCVFYRNRSLIRTFSENITYAKTNLSSTISLKYQSTYRLPRMINVLVITWWSLGCRRADAKGNDVRSLSDVRVDAKRWSWVCICQLVGVRKGIRPTKLYTKLLNSKQQPLTPVYLENGHWYDVWCLSLSSICRHWHWLWCLGSRKDIRLLTVALQKHTLS